MQCLRLFVLKVITWLKLRVEEKMESVRAFSAGDCESIFSVTNVINTGVPKTRARKPSLTLNKLKRVSGTLGQPRFLLGIQNTDSIYLRNTSLNTL